jgi:hypothetical protein
MSVSFRQGSFRIAPYATGADVSTAISAKADASTVSSLSSSLSSLSSAVSGKADSSVVSSLSSSLSSLSSAVSGKADASALSNKANQSDLETLASIVDNKADASALDAKAPQTEVDALNQMAEILCGAEGALNVMQEVGGSTPYVYDGSLQSF